MKQALIFFIIHSIVATFYAIQLEIILMGR